MSVAIKVEVKTFGQKNSQDSSWEVFIDQIPVKYTLRDLIASVVQEEVNLFNQKYHHNRLSPVLSFDEIEQGTADGKIGFAVKSIYQIVNSQTAVEKTLEAYQLGHYYVFVDGIQIGNLDDEVKLESHSKVRFIRVIPLAGG